MEFEIKRKCFEKEAGRVHASYVVDKLAVVCACCCSSSAKVVGGTLLDLDYVVCPVSPPSLIKVTIAAQRALTVFVTLRIKSTFVSGS